MEPPAEAAASRVLEWVERVEGEPGLLDTLHTAYSSWLPPCAAGPAWPARERAGGWVREGRRAGGAWHGYCREREEGGEGLLIGRWSGGRRVGPHWRREQGGLWTVSSVDLEGRPEGEGLVLFPDLVTLLAGEFLQGRLVAGCPGRLGGLTLHLGVPWPLAVGIDSSQVVHGPFSHSFCSLWSLRPVQRAGAGPP
jgi:hypothetical protein